MAAKTRFGLEGYGVRRAGSFAGKTFAGNPHLVGILTRLSMDGYGARRAGTFTGKTTAGAATRGNWDTSDPLFAEWWRKRAQELRQQIDEPASVRAIEPVIAKAAQTLRPARPKLESLEAASTAAELRMLSQELSRAQRRMIEYLIAEYERQQDEDEAIMLLLLH